LDLKDTLKEPVSKYVATAFATVSFDDSVTDAAKSMQRSKTTEAVVMNGDDAIGIITERDILYKVVATGMDPAQVKVRAVMSAPVATVDSGLAVAEAIAKMEKLGIRRLGVTSGSKFVGLITQTAVVTGKPGRQLVLPELAAPETIACPYCGAVVAAGELSTHIDHAHMGRGLLQGDTTKW
jgi:CBS domain-containing protein